MWSKCCPNTIGYGPRPKSIDAIATKDVPSCVSVTVCLTIYDIQIKDWRFDYKGGLVFPLKNVWDWDVNCNIVQ